MQFLLSFFTRIWTISIGLRVFVSLFIPLVIVKVVSHLPYSLCARSLILYWHSCQSSGSIELHVAGIQNVLIVVVDLHVLVTSNALIIVTSHWSLLNAMQVLQFSSNFFRLCLSCFIIIFFLLFWLMLGRCRRWRFCACFDVVRWKEPLLVRPLYHMTEPPAILECLLHQYFFTLLHVQIRNFFFFIALLLISLIITLFLALLIKFIFSLTSQLLLMVLVSYSLQCVLLIVRVALLFFEEWLFLLFLLLLWSEGTFRKIVKGLCNKHNYKQCLKQSYMTVYALKNPSLYLIIPIIDFEYLNILPGNYHKSECLYGQWKKQNSIIFVKMRYQPRNNRSLSYLLKESINPVDHKQRDNKENANTLNHPVLKEKPFKEIHHAQEDAKLERKVRSSTGVTVSSFIKKISIPEQLKKTYTQMVMEDYVDDISQYMCQSSERSQCQQMLIRHEISSSLRSKMVDWMIEVLSSYKMTEETFFKSIYVMDSYMKKSKVKMEVKDLHLIGVASMFIASKYQEIHPLKLEVLYDKIARKKFRKSQILQKESEIVEALSFTLENASVYDICRIITQKIKYDLSDKATKYFEKIVLYLSKMVLFNAQLSGKCFSLLAGGVAYIALKTLEQAQPEVNSQHYLPNICQRLNIDSDKVIQISRRVLDLAKNYSNYFPTLTNLKKFNRFEYNLQ